ncbi:MAG: trehalose-phosphatase [Hyphomicrobiales bacterium]|jgi:trehalose 6-phosphate phosphatase
MSGDRIEDVARAVLALEKPALCLDFDGTLVEIAPRPEAITVADYLPALLRALCERFDDRVAIVTGRTHSDLSRHLDVTSFPVASGHGAEFSAPESVDVQSLLDRADLDPLRPKIAAAIRGYADVYLEDKGTAIAVHTRPNPSAHDPLLDQMHALADHDEKVHVGGGKGIVELRLASENKGTALTRLANLKGWRGAQPVMIGDDTTDNDGMAVAKTLGGFGIQVGNGPNGTKLSHAAFSLASVSQAHKLLQLLTR